MTALTSALSQYAEYHQNRTNQIIHKICVPAITWSLLGLLWVVHPWIACGFALLSLVFYLRLSLPLALAMAAFAGATLLTLPYVPYLAATAAVVFVVAWIGQFIGHKIEGKKPAFFEDLRFLLIGPLWVWVALIPGLGHPDRAKEA